MSPRAGLEQLTPRQREILELMAKGLTNEDIAGALGISGATVKTHITALLATLDVSNRTEAAALLHAADDGAAVAALDEVLGRPGIAVLPLLALDDAPRSRTIARAIGSDLASLFACSCWFPVIAQVSTDNARALGTTSEAIGQALGARFLVDGTLRTSRGPGGAPGWRLTVQVDDVERRECLWTERYDFGDDEVFDVQETLAAIIVATAYPVLVARVQLGLRKTPRAQSAAAWELAHRGLGLCLRREAAGAVEARTRLVQALERDPTSVLAHYGLGLGAYDAVLNQWRPIDDARAQLLESATRCQELAPHVGEGYFLQARYHQTLGDHARAVPLLETAVAKNPSFAQAHALLAQTLHIIGRSDEGMVRMRHALRLGPRAFVSGLALLHFMRSEYHDALTQAEAAVAFAPRYTFARVVAASAAHFLGERDRADDHRRRLVADYPPFAPSHWLRNFGPEVDSVRRIGEALTALGLGA
ncbi:MAG: tetratricopeptide repeat protein [Planctomycetes bacterium]|nr:tetratricopeptide repeat protein [Planctomycetota bacterium]